MTKVQKSMEEWVSSTADYETFESPEAYVSAIKQKVYLAGMNEHYHCPTCLIEWIAKCSSSRLYGFFSDLLKQQHDWQHREIAMEWFLLYNTPEARELIWNTLTVIDQTSSDTCDLTDSDKVDV